MRPLSILSRLLLCVLLTLNGIGGASAALRMAVEHVGHAPAVATHSMAGTKDDATPSCHGNVDLTGVAAASPQHHAMAHDASPTAPAASTHAGQCCDSSSCQCACAHQSAATIVANVVPASPVPALDRSRTLDLGHRAPTLPHLIRPPIS